MQGGGAPWVLILAGGEGQRLRSLTTTEDGIATPKQFCSLRGGPSLLQETMRRGATVAPPGRTVVCVAAHHRRWWQSALSALPPRNVVVQPAARGTGIGLLLPVLRIARQDPDAPLLVLPCDHYIRDEPVLAAALQRAAEHVRAHGDEILLLGIRPDRPDPELGYIVPGCGSADGIRDVAEFVEKPTVPQARALIRRGAAWNAFIIAARARAVLRLFEASQPGVAAALAATQAPEPGGDGCQAALEAVYDRLPLLDFSRDILQGQTRLLRLLCVAPCGWTDLGTPRRVRDTLRRLSRLAAPEIPLRGQQAHLVLARAYARASAAGAI